MKHKLIFAVVSFLSMQTYALACPPQESNICPTVQAIQSVGIGEMKRHKDGTWGAVVIDNNYQTALPWTFTIYGIKAENAALAANKARKIIASMQPAKTAYRDILVRWTCRYPNDAEGVATYAASRPYA